MSYRVGFPPIAKRDAKVLILGSMPGQRSLAKNQYYAHPRNAFWPIICALFNANEGLNYARRKALLRNNKIALWDVLKRCYRPGSLDAKIDPAGLEPNDFAPFFVRHVYINTVFFNGKKAARLFRQYVLQRLNGQYANLRYEMLPSTSPAYAAMTMQQKLLKWRLIRDVH